MGEISLIKLDNIDVKVSSHFRPFQARPKPTQPTTNSAHANSAHNLTNSAHSETNSAHNLSNWAHINMSIILYDGEL